MVARTTASLAREAQPAVRRRQILRAASRAFRERGFHATGMRDVAAACGMTVGNLYYYFENKQDLLAFCQEDAVQRLLALHQWVAARGLAAPEHLYLLVVGHTLCLNEGTPGSLAHLEVEGLSPQSRERIVAQRDRYERALRAVIRAGNKDGDLRAADAKVATLAILGAVNWTVKWFRTDGRKTALAIGEQFAEQLVQGLLAPGRSLQRPDVTIPAELINDETETKMEVRG
ncbi:MAG: TetR/AcrR family transcriptional regulator [Planctomycetota bacterium]